MKYLKKYMLLCSTLFFIILGAAMPKLASKIQDAQISGFQKKTELSTVNLTLRQESDVGPVLHLMSKDHDESPWDGETRLSKADASHAALAVAETLNQHGLLPEEKLKDMSQSDGDAKPLLVVGEDGSSALIWSCTWDDAPDDFITVDDATGKAIRILVRNEPTDDGTTEDIYTYQDRWLVFLQDYYDIELTDVIEDSNKTNGKLSVLCALHFSSKDGATLYDFSLNITSDYMLFNEVIPLTQPRVNNSAAMG